VARNGSCSILARLQGSRGKVGIAPILCKLGRPRSEKATDRGDSLPARGATAPASPAAADPVQRFEGLAPRRVMRFAGQAFRSATPRASAASARLGARAAVPQASQEDRPHPRNFGKDVERGAEVGQAGRVASSDPRPQRAWGGPSTAGVGR
jgi:hypothetical protein